MIAVPAVFITLGVGVPLAPLVFVFAFVVDAAARMPNLPTVRFVSLAYQLLALEVAAIVAALGLWVSRRGIAAHSRVQSWWAGQVVRAAWRSLHVRFEVTGEETIQPGPVIVLCRHASYVDALLPALIFGTRSGFQLRYVIAQELTWLPSLNLFGHRLPNVFVERGTRADGQAERVGRLATGLTGDIAVVIFPEGQFPTAARRDRVLASVERSDPERFARVSALRHVLPPRPAGTIALMEAAPDVDIVVMAHRGLERLDNLRSLWREVPLAAPVEVQLSRVASPTTERERWLDDQWASIDAWLDQHR